MPEPQPESAAADAFADRLEALAARAMDHWRIPGMAVALVLPGAAPVLKTYGTRDTRSGAPVTPRTQFHACSLTKSLTAAGLLLLLEQQGIALTTRVRDLLPGFRLADPVATDQLTLRDLLCHASGLPRHDKIWTPGDLAPAQMLERLRHLAPSSGLRERFQYNNLGYVVLAAVTERLCGTSWEAYTTKALLEPLGFVDFSFSPEALAAAQDHAHPHLRDGADVVPGGRIWPAPVAAGGLNASIADMARWLQFLLGTRKLGSDPKFPELGSDPKFLQQMMTPWMYSGTSPHPEIGACHYGLGLSCEHYRGLRVAAHGGSMPGFGTLLALLPDEGAGVVVLTNRDPSPVPNLLAFAVFDAVSGKAPVDWFTRFAAQRARALEEEAQERNKQQPSPSAATRPLADYAGCYVEPAYGELQVVHQDDRLAWTWRGLGGILQPLHHDTFRLEEAPPARHADALAGTFLYHADGHIDRVSIPLEPEVAPIVFGRKAVA